MPPIDMNGNASSAVVVAFPFRAAAAERLRARRQATMQAMTVAYEDGWYHAEAIRKDRMERERDGSAGH